MRDLFIGVDPGASGAIAFFRPTIGWLMVHDMPVHVVRSGKSDKKVVAEDDLARIFFTHAHPDHAPPTIAIVEKVSAMPDQGVSSMFNFGMSFGVIRGVLAACGIPRNYVPPVTWKRATKTPAGKDGARQRAAQVFPAHAGLFSRAKDDGRAEAALIAYYGFLQEGGIA